MATAIRSVREEQRRLSAELRGQHRTWVQIGVVFRKRYGVTMLAALRMVRDWSQRDAAEQWNRRWPDDLKTYKTFSYWEVWPAPTGHAPSLSVLARLAELYECSVSDLLSDYADFRSSDNAHLAADTLAKLPEITSSSTGSVLAELASADVHQIARIAATWTDRIGDASNRRALLLKLAAGISLAAASPSVAHAADDDQPTADAVGPLGGVWHSRYAYPSTGRQANFVGEHFVVVKQHGTSLTAESVPAENGSVLNLDLRLAGSVATGTWSERTSQSGYYRGAVYHGAIQLVVDPMGKAMSGKWLGFDREFRVNSDMWELRWMAPAGSREVIRSFHRKV